MKNISRAISFIVIVVWFFYIHTVTLESIIHHFSGLIIHKCSAIKLPKDWEDNSIYVPLKGTLQHCLLILSNMILSCKEILLQLLFLFLVGSICLFYDDMGVTPNRGRQFNIYSTKVYFVQPSLVQRQPQHIIDYTNRAQYEIK